MRGGRLSFSERFEVITAIQSHHYMSRDERKKATECVYRALKSNGIYICFENIVPEDNEVKEFELHRWGRYQQRQGKTEDEANAHIARCGKYYFPITMSEHIQLLKEKGFCKVNVFWLSHMQMGIYGSK